jgi:gamma-glutamylcysteine synthetase
MVNDYAKWLPEIKTIFKYNTNGETEYFNGPLGKMMISEPKAVQQNILSALHQSFTHVRFKTFLEVRASDRPPKGMEMAPAAFLAGLLTAPNTRSEGLNVVLRWSKKERNELIAAAHDLSYDQSGPENKPIGDWLSFFSNLCLQGLDERAKHLKIKNETPLVRSFLENVLLNGPKTIQVQNEFQKMGLSIQAFLKDYCLDSAS